MLHRSITPLMPKNITLHQKELKTRKHIRRYQDSKYLLLYLFFFDDFLTTGLVVNVWSRIHGMSGQFLLKIKAQLFSFNFLLAEAFPSYAENLHAFCFRLFLDLV